MELSGVVVSGTGKATDFVSKRGYLVQLRRTLEMDIFPGTLNLRVDLDEKEAFLAQVRGFELTGFTDDGVEYGDLTVYPVILPNGDAAGILVLEKTTHEADIVEIVAAYNLRKKFTLSDNSVFSVTPGAYVYPQKH
ncbi:MAG: DUF120 domain-containing protein [Candidatus Diapherotrites archaeon]|nr:DUF120 domain-containing protein [Candidatus Diapherotrites archaeon]